jgi:ATP-dependent helicase HrpB
VRDALIAHRSLVLQAPPGAGKTTLVPLALLGAEWLGGQRIVILEPRRLATRAAAWRMADLRGESVGGSVGYRMRGDTRVGSDTRVEVVTEGVLTRRLQRDPTLDGVGIVIFDEFHERTLDADLGLALTRRTQTLVRDDLRILVMSATLDGDRVARLLDNAPLLTSEGRVHPVDTHYRPPRRGATLEAAVNGAIAEALRSETGDVLAFLPGAGEIRRVEALLSERDLGGVVVAPLYGVLSRDAQERAIRPDPAGRRKVVLATSIAETSLTIEGVRVVIDSGWSRVPSFSPRTGMTRLETVRVTRASADQRRGRAGRLGPGVCFRLWSEAEQHHLLDHAQPEIANADLAPLVLDLAAAGVVDPLELEWLDPPASPAFAQARELLLELEAVDAAGTITPHGSDIAALPVHPRLGHMLVRSRALGATRLACDVAALLSDRDIVRAASGPHVGPDVDLALRVEALRGVGPRGSSLANVDVDGEAARRVRADADRLARQLGDGPPSADLEALGMLAALAYPDRVAQRRPGAHARYTLRNGHGADLGDGQSLSQAHYLVAAEVDDRRPNSRIFRGAAITVDEIRATFADQIIENEIVEFDESSGAVVARRREMLGALVLREAVFPGNDPALVRAALLTAVRRRGVAALEWSDAATRLRQRVAFVGRHEPGWPDLSDDALDARLDEWLAPALTEARRLSDVERIDLVAALGSLLDWRQRRSLDALAPTHIQVPSGSRIPIDYSDPESPILAVRIQEVFGLTESPRLLGGRVPVTMHLLSPAQRPVQVTRDLAGFWRTSYFDVRRDMRGRYPKHDWPEDPLAAVPTRRVKRRMD